MGQVLGVEFQKYGQLHYLAAAADEKVGDKVLYPTEQGNEVATVVWRGETEIEDLPKCAGYASEEECERDAENRRYRKFGRQTAEKLIAEMGLQMRVIAVDVVDSEPGCDRQFVVYYTAPERVDFRALVPKLASAVQARVDLRQVGARDAARVVGGIGRCGLTLCCASRLRCLVPVTAPEKISGPVTGACGRLLCCLRFEQ